MRDRLVVFEGEGMRLVCCTLAESARDAARRHSLAEGSALVLGQAMCGALLLAAHAESRTDVQLDCPGPLRGLLADADESGAVRGLVRAGELAATFDGDRLDARPLLASAHDERAGRLSVVRAGPPLHRAVFPFAGADLGAALTLALRGESEAGGEVALEALRPLGPIGALLAPLDEREPSVAEARDAAASGGVRTVAPPRGLFDGSTGGLEPRSDEVRRRGKPLRQGGLLRAAAALASLEELPALLGLGQMRVARELEPHFACRCSRARVVEALRTLSAAELLDMASRDGGARCGCDFCGETYLFSAAELRSFAELPS